MLKLHSFRVDHFNFAEAYNCGGIYSSSSSLEAFDTDRSDMGLLYDLVDVLGVTTQVSGNDDIVYGTIAQLPDERIYFISTELLMFCDEAAKTSLSLYSNIGFAIEAFLNGVFGLPTDGDIKHFNTHGIGLHICEVPEYKFS